MAYSSINKLKLYKDIQRITREEFLKYHGYKKYSDIWRDSIANIYHIGYHAYIRIINTPNLDTRIKEIETKLNPKSEGTTPEDDNQLKMF